MTVDPGQSSRVAVFARANHPEGWGGASGLAHGWSILLVTLDEDDQLSALMLKLQHPGTRLPDVLPNGEFRQTPWYGGSTFDYLFTITDGTLDRPLFTGYQWLDHGVLSVGDNRCLARFTAKEIMADAA